VESFQKFSFWKAYFACEAALGSMKKWTGLVLGKAPYKNIEKIKIDFYKGIAVV
jgi:hypothetical protein